LTTSRTLYASIHSNTDRIMQLTHTVAVIIISVKKSVLP